MVLPLLRARVSVQIYRCTAGPAVPTCIRLAPWSLYRRRVDCDIFIRDQPNSREKMHDFTAEFLKCVKFHGKFTERVSEIHEAHRRYFKVLC